jgi:hypothetical protein
MSNANANPEPPLDEGRNFRPSCGFRAESHAKGFEATGDELQGQIQEGIFADTTTAWLQPVALTFPTGDLSGMTTPLETLQEIRNGGGFRACNPDPPTIGLWPRRGGGNWSFSEILRGPGPE